MSTGKIASQVGHVCKRVGWLQEATLMGDGFSDKIIVLGLRQNKFNEKLKEVQEKIDDDLIFIQNDLGHTEVEKDTMTVFGYIDEI